MSKSTNKTTRGGAPKSPKDKPGVSTLKHYMTQGASPRNMEAEKQGKAKVENKKGTDKKAGETPEHSREDFISEGESESSRIEGRPSESLPPTKGEMNEMLLRLEKSIKADINMMRGDLGSLLDRVEETEKIVENQKKELETLKQQMKIAQQTQKEILYKLEDQENRNRRQNIRLRSVPERGRRSEENVHNIARLPYR